MKTKESTCYQAARATVSALGLALTTGFLFVVVARLNFCGLEALLPPIAEEIQEETENRYDKTLSSLLICPELTTIARPDGSRKVSAIELAMARCQGKHVATIAHRVHPSKSN